MGEWATEVPCQVECITVVMEEECITTIDPISKLKSCCILIKRLDIRSDAQFKSLTVLYLLHLRLNLL